VVLFDELERGLGPDRGDAVRVVAAAEDAEVDELVARQAEAREDFVVGDFQHFVAVAFRFAALRERQAAQLARRRERQHVHVFGARRERLAAAHELGALRLRLARRVHDGDAHQLQQDFDVVGVLARHFHEGAFGFLDRRDVAAFFRGCEVFLRFRPFRASLLELPALHGRRLAVEDVDWLDAGADQPDRPVEHALNVRRLLAVRVRQHRRRLPVPVRRPNRNQKLIQRHARVNRHFPPHVRLDVHLLHRLRRLVVDHAHQPLDTHPLDK